MMIHFFAGVHEVYFPYLIMKPILMLGPILGNMLAIFYFCIHGCGLLAPASPGSVFSILFLAPKSDTWYIVIGILISTMVSFMTCHILLFNVKKEKNPQRDEVIEMKGEKKLDLEDGFKKKRIFRIVFACDVGMGSSALGAKMFANRLEKSVSDIKVSYAPVDEIPSDAELVVVQEALADRAKASAPNARLVLITHFLEDPQLDLLYDEICKIYEQKDCAQESLRNPSVMQEVSNERVDSKEKHMILPEGIRIQLPSVSKEEAIRQAAFLLASLGYVDEDYGAAMIERENLVTTYFGMGVAIPHGTLRAKEKVKKRKPFYSGKNEIFG